MTYLMSSTATISQVTWRVMASPSIGSVSHYTQLTSRLSSLCVSARGRRSRRSTASCVLPVLSCPSDAPRMRRLQRRGVVAAADHFCHAAHTRPVCHPRRTSMYILTTCPTIYRLTVSSVPLLRVHLLAHLWSPQTETQWICGVLGRHGLYYIHCGILEWTKKTIHVIWSGSTTLAAKTTIYQPPGAFARKVSMKINAQQAPVSSRDSA